MTEVKPCDRAQTETRHPAHMFVLLQGDSPLLDGPVQCACPGWPVVRAEPLPGFEYPAQDGRPSEGLSEDAGGPETSWETQRSALAGDLEGWWMERATEEAMAVIPKAVEYGSNSLEKFGRFVAGLPQRTDLTTEEALELGSFAYAYGKMLRWEDSAQRSERPSDDTIHDIGVYTRMVQRIRDTGSWPGKGATK